MIKSKKNMNLMDRIARFVVAAVLIILVIFGPVRGPLGFILIILSIFFLIASFTGFCMFYKSINADFNNSDEYFK
jgi:hypothetical protein